MKTILKTGLFLSLLTPLIGQASPQSLDTLGQSSEKEGATLITHPGARGTLSYIGGTLSKSVKDPIKGAHLFLKSHGDLLGVTEGMDLRLTRQENDKMGGTHLLFEQHHGGVAVFGARLSIHMDPSGVIKSVNGSIVPNLDLSTDHILPAASLNDLLKMELGDSLKNAGTPTLWIRTTSAESAVLAYQLPAFMSHEGKTMPLSLWVDARTGELLFSENPIMDAKTEGSGTDVLGDSTPLNIFEGSRFRLKVSPVLRPYVQQAEKGAYNLVDQTTPELGYIYTWDCNETYMMDVDYVNSNDSTFDNAIDPGHPAGVSAHNYARQTLDFYWETYSRQGLDGNGLSVASLVQIADPIESYPLEINAGWAGYGFNFMIYGAGGEWPIDSGIMWRSFSASLDVIGHELNHAVDEFTVNLGYQHESGALNEHLADVFGVLTQSYWQGIDWLMGEQLFEEPQYPYDAVRSFADPPLYNQPDRMSIFRAEPLTYDAGGVHFNSGIGNKAFYLAVTGGTFNGVLVPAIHSDEEESLRIAGEVWYDVMVNVRVNPSSQLLDMRQATLDAAAAIHPEAVTSLTRAWNAVEVSDDFYPDPAVDVVEPNDYGSTATVIEMGESVEGYLWNRADCDMYALEGGGDVIVRLKDLPTGARLAVYKPGLFGTLSNVASSNNPDLQEESLLINLSAGTTYYIEVMVDETGVGSDSETYTLEIAPVS